MIPGLWKSGIILYNHCRKYNMRKIKYYLYPVLLVICLYSCSSTDDDKQEPQPPIEIPDADELASIGVGLVAYYTFDNETGDDSSPNH